MTRGKKIKGRKRHIIVDTLGLIISAEVHSASIQHRNGGLELLKKAKQEYDSIVKFFADGGYSGKLQDQSCLETAALLTIAKRVTDKEFEVIPKRPMLSGLLHATKF